MIELLLVRELMSKVTQSNLLKIIETNKTNQKKIHQIKPFEVKTKYMNMIISSSRKRVQNTKDIRGTT